MTDQQSPEYPEKIWIYPCDIESMKWTGLIETVDPERPWEQQDYVRADLLEAAEKRIKELEDERDQALASVGAVIEKAMDAANEADSLELSLHGSVRIVMRIHAINPDATADLNEMRAEAWDDGWICRPVMGMHENPHRKGQSDE